MGGEVLEYPAKTILRQGIEQGIERGRKQGEEKKAVETAVNLVKLGKVTLEEIAAATSLPLEQVKELEKQTMQPV
jgi:predicted transposase/invertase (TIGR01784 family)